MRMTDFFGRCVFVPEMPSDVQAQDESVQAFAPRVREEPRHRMPLVRQDVHVQAFDAPSPLEYPSDQNTVELAELLGVMLPNLPRNEGTIIFSFLID